MSKDTTETETVLRAHIDQLQIAHQAVVKQCENWRKRFEAAEAERYELAENMAAVQSEADQARIEHNHLATQCFSLREQIGELTLALERVAFAGRELEKEAPPKMSADTPDMRMLVSLKIPIPPKLQRLSEPLGYTIPPQLEEVGWIHLGRECRAIFSLEAHVTSWQLLALVEWVDDLNAKWQVRAKEKSHRAKGALDTTPPVGQSATGSDLRCWRSRQP